MAIKNLNTAPLISVIMSFYNPGKFIAEAIESILNQTFTDFEFIIINDGSDDDSENIVNSYSDERIRYFSNPHQGIVRQLNFGIEKSKGELIARMDADDISHAERLDEQYKFLLANSHISAAGTNYYRIDGNGKVLYKKKQLIDFTDCKFFAPINAPLLHPSTLIRKKVFFEIGFYSENHESIEDYEFFNRMINAGNIISNIDKFLFSYRLNKAHINSQREKHQQKSIYEYGRKMLDAEIEISANNPIPHFQIAILEYYLGKISTARKYLLKTINLKPRLFFKAVRYFPLTLLGDKLVNLLRKNLILYKISTFLRSKFGIDLHKAGS